MSCQTCCEADSQERHPTHADAGHEEKIHQSIDSLCTLSLWQQREFDLLMWRPSNYPLNKPAHTPSRNRTPPQKKTSAHTHQLSHSCHTQRRHHLLPKLAPQLLQLGEG